MTANTIAAIRIYNAEEDSVTVKTIYAVGKRVNAKTILIIVAAINNLRIKIS